MSDLIEKLGGYEKAKRELELKEQNSVLQCCITVTAEMIRDALLDYRRQHNIFEVGDKVVYVDDFMPNSVSVVSEVNDRVWLNDNNAVCIKEMIKHAEDEEIKAGKRLEVS